MAGLSDMLKDPNFIARLLMEERLRKEAAAAAAEQAGPQMGPLPNMPPMPPRAVAENYRRPGSPTMPAEQMIADTMAGPPAAGFYGGQAIGEGMMHGSPADMAGGASQLALGMIGGVGAKRRPIPRERFGDADTSHIGMLPWMTTPALATAGGYAGSQIDDKDSNVAATLGAILGGATGFGTGVVPALRHMEKRAKGGAGADDWGGADPAWQAKLAASRAKHLQSPAAPQSPAPAAPQPPQQPPMTLAKRLREYEPLMSPASPPKASFDLDGPVSSVGKAGLKPTPHGWKDKKTGRFTEPPDNVSMTEGFSDADLSAARKK